MKTIHNLPTAHLMPFSEIEEKRPTLLVTSTPAWNAVKNHLRGLNIVETIEVTEATTEYWDSLLTAESPSRFGRGARGEGRLRVLHRNQIA